MAGSFEAKLLAAGQVPNAVTAVYTVPASTTAYVRTILFYNTTGSNRIVDTYINDGGGNAQVWRLTCAANASASVEFGIVLEATHVLSLDDDSAGGADVNYFVFGVLET